MNENGMYSNSSYERDQQADQGNSMATVVRPHPRARGNADSRAIAQGDAKTAQIHLAGGSLVRHRRADRSAERSAELAQADDRRRSLVDRGGYNPTALKIRGYELYRFYVHASANELLNRGITREQALVDALENDVAIEAAERWAEQTHEPEQVDTAQFWGGAEL